MEQTLMIHRYKDGGARFGWAYDLSQVDCGFWRVADSDEAELWIILQLLRKAECRDDAFGFALEEYQSDPVGALGLIRLVHAIEDGRYQLPSETALGESDG